MYVILIMKKKTINQKKLLDKSPTLSKQFEKD